MISLIIFSWMIQTAQAEVVDPCLQTEHWSFEQKQPKWLKEFHEYSSGRQTHLQSLSQALKLKKMSLIMTSSELEEDFSEYWVGRVFFDLKLDHLAHSAFMSVFENAHDPELKKAAYACLVRVQMHAPDWKAPSIQVAKSLHWTDADSDVLFLAQLHAKTMIMEKTLKTNYQYLLRGFIEQHEKHYTDAIVNFENYFGKRGSAPNVLLNTFEDQARVAYGRALYSVARFKDSTEQFQKVKKNSNMEIEALSNLSWAYLMMEKYEDAIGIALQLRSGALKQAFAPEPLMVAAMSLNELCDYPESIRMIQAFVKDYHFIDEWIDQKSKSDFDYYAEVVNTLKGKRTAPPKIVSDWIRTPDFLIRQKEMNFLIAEPTHLKDYSGSMKNELSRESTLFVKKASALIKELRIAQLKLKPGESLSSDYSDRFFELKKDLRKLMNLSHGFKTWQKISKNYEGLIPSLRAQLVKKVNKDLKARTFEVSTLLEKIKNNSDLIEVEIYNGASQDIVWKSAHPEYEAMSENVKNQKANTETNHDWKWGRFPASELDNSEVWEDELGALKADVRDQCTQAQR